MKDLLIELDQILRRKNPALYERLDDSLTDYDIDKVSKPLKFPLPDEVRLLYKWKNGTRNYDDASLTKLWIIPMHVFNYFEESMQRYTKYAR